MLCTVFSKYWKIILEKSCTVGVALGNLVKKKNLFVSQATKHLESLIHHENARMPDSWVTDQPCAHSLSPCRGAPLIPCVCSSWAAQLVCTVCKPRAQPRKRGQTEQNSPHSTAGNSLGDGNFLLSVRERFHTFSFLSPSRETGEVCSSAHPVQAPGHNLTPAQVPIPGTPVQSPGSCHPTLALLSHLCPAIPPGSSWCLKS